MSKAIINIYGEVIPWQDSNVLEWGAVNLKSVKDAISNATDSDELEVHIHSNGGDVNEGFAIYDMLVNSGKKVTTIVDGNCFSIATVIFMAGSTRQMSKNAQFMIHNPWGGAFGDAEEIQKYADQVKDAENRILDFYVDKTGGDRDTIKSMMDAETYLTSDQALELKFATAIIEPVQARIRAHFKQNNTLQMSTVIEKLEAGFASINNLLKEKFGIKAEATEIKAAMVKTQDGEELEITMAGEKVAVGDTVKKGGEDFTGTATLEDGTVITCDAGKVTEVSAPSSASEEDEATKALKDENEQLKAKVQEQETALNDFKTQLDSITNHLKNLKTDYKPGQTGTVFNKGSHDQPDGKTIEQIRAEKEKLKEELKNKK
jgi:ATP-dependent Clp endopeptidase proteolytic subunit ClpP